ncbi:MAG: hypothetical protein FK734_03215 [Asgard group archaeon]|nr:hypothetical protein [Asgard group archaeon]
MPAHLLGQFIDHWITDGFSIQDIRDILLEFLAVIAFLFLLVVVIIALTKAPILNSHGSIEVLIFVLLGLIHAVMNVLDEFIWFVDVFYVKVWKPIKDITLLLGAVLLLIGFFRFFLFSERLFGTSAKDKILILKEEDTDSDSS